MNVWTVVNSLILVFGIGFWLYLISNNIIHAVTEESRKTSEQSAKLLDKWLDKVCSGILDVAKGFKELADDETTKINQLK